MKAKKIIIIALSALVVALIVALVSVSIAAGNENLSIAEYFAKIAKNEKLDESTLVIINGEEKSIESFEKLIRVYSALDAVFDSEKLENEFNQFVDAQLLTQEAQRRGITASRDEIQEQLDYQKESFLLALEGGDEIAKMFVDIYKGLGMTVEEYYASDEAYQYYYDLMCMNTLLKQEAEQKGITAEEARTSLLTRLRGSAKIEVNREKLNLLKKEADEVAAYYREQGITADVYYETSDGNEQCRKAVMLKKLAEKLKDDYDKATASQEVKELKSATKLYYELYRKRYEKATILINQKNVDGYIETYHIKKSVT